MNLSLKYITAIVGVAYCFTFTGCSSRSTTFSVSLPLFGGTSGVAECVEISSFSTVHQSPRTYRCSASPKPIFTTVVKDCSVGEKFTTQATTRQLLVGFSGLKVLSQETVDLERIKALRSVVNGKLDLDTIQLATFTTRDGECVTDLAIWRAASLDPIADSQADFVLSATKLAQVILSSFKAS